MAIEGVPRGIVAGRAAVAPALVSIAWRTASMPGTAPSRTSTVTPALASPAARAKASAFARAQEESAGSTHAWLQVYLPGAGWIPFDPTNDLIGGHELIRVGVARHASLASPLSGTWTGAPADYLGMSVDVQVRKRSG